MVLSLPEPDTGALCYFLNTMHPHLQAFVFSSPVNLIQCKIWLNEITFIGYKETIKLQNTNMRLFRSAAELVSGGLDGLVKQRSDVFLFISVSSTQDHDSILHKEKRNEYSF